MFIKKNKYTVHKNFSRMDGVGPYLKNIYINKLGCLNTSNYNFLNKKYFKKIKKVKQLNSILITFRLKSRYKLQKEYFEKLLNLRYLRFLSGYPVRGQRTHSNAKSSRKKFIGINLSNNKKKRNDTKRKFFRSK